MSKLTKRVVDASNPAEKRYFVWDSTLPGFGLVVQPTGVKSYCYQYRDKHGRTARITIGRHGDGMTTEQARDEAQRLNADVVKGGDPRGDIAADREAVTVKAVLEAYMASEKFAEKTAETKVSDKGRINRHLIPTLGTKIAVNLTFEQMRKARTAIEKGKTAVREKTGPRGLAKVTGGPGAARMSMRLLKSAYTWAKESGLISANPTEGFETGVDGERKTVIRQDDYAKMFRTIDEMERTLQLPVKVAEAIRVVAFTGARRGEIARLRWSHVNLKAGILEIPVAQHKTGKKTKEPRIIGLPAEAQKIISKQPEGAPNDYVFPPSKGKGAISLSARWRQVREAAGLPLEMGLHGLRHTLATQMAMSGRQAPEIMAVMGHRNLSTSQKYVHMAQDARAALAEKAAAGITAALQGKTDKASVVEIKTRRKRKN